MRYTVYKVELIIPCVELHRALLQGRIISLTVCMNLLLPWKNQGHIILLGDGDGLGDQVYSQSHL